MTNDGVTVDNPDDNNNDVVVNDEASSEQIINYKKMRSTKQQQQQQQSANYHQPLQQQQQQQYNPKANKPLVIRATTRLIQPFTWGIKKSARMVGIRGGGGGGGNKHATVVSNHNHKYNTADSQRMIIVDEYNLDDEIPDGGQMLTERTHNRSSKQRRSSAGNASASVHRRRTSHRSNSYRRGRSSTNQTILTNNPQQRMNKSERGSNSATTPRLANNNTGTHKNTGVSSRNYQRNTSSSSLETVQTNALSLVERTLRTILFAMIFYLLGIIEPFPFITKDGITYAIQMVGVSWFTCLLITIATWWETSKRRRLLTFDEDDDSSIEGRIVYRQDNDNDGIRNTTTTTTRRRTLIQNEEEEEGEEFVTTATHEQIPVMNMGSFALPNPTFENDLEFDGPPSMDHDEIAPLLSTPSASLRNINTRCDEINNENEIIIEEPESSSPDASTRQTRLRTQPRTTTTTSTFTPPPQHHPELEDLYVIDSTTKDRLYPNGQTVPVDNEYFAGKMFAMFRTSDADEPTEPSITGGTNYSNAVSNYLRKKQRRFEIQLQIKFKKSPDGQIFIGCELEEPFKLGMVQRAFMGATMNFVKKRNNGFRYNLHGDTESTDGRYEKTHVAFPTETTFDRIVITKAGEEPPQLGGELHEDEEAMKKRKKGGRIHFNTEDTYSLSFWSAYVDFLKWKCVNMPAIRPFNLSSVIGNQPFSLSFYIADPNLRKHYECDKNKIVAFEFGNKKKTRFGPEAKAWMQKSRKANHISNLDVSLDRTMTGDILPQVNDEEDPIVDTDAEQNEESENEDEDEDSLATEGNGALGDLGKGIYLNSGDPVILSGSISPDTTAFLTNTGGIAVLQTQTASTIVFEKSSRSKRERNSKEFISQPKLIKSGDAVRVKMIQKHGKDGSTTTKHLAIHRGWWLKWANSPSKTNGLFQIFTNEVEEPNDMTNAFARRSLSFETQSSFLRLGGTFQLRTYRKNGLYVGIKPDSSASFGGWLMGLYKEDDYRSSEDEACEIDDNDVDDEIGEGVTALDSKKLNNDIKALHLCAHTPENIGQSSTSPEKILINTFQESPMKLGTIDNQYSAPSAVEKFNADAPAWLEVMHRTKRIKQQVYMIRIVNSSNKNTVESKCADGYESENQLGVSEHDKPVISNPAQSQIRLRTSTDLSATLQFGFSLMGKTKYNSYTRELNSDGEGELDDFGNDSITPSIVNDQHDLRVNDDNDSAVFTDSTSLGLPPSHQVSGMDFIIAKSEQEEDEGSRFQSSISADSEVDIDSDAGLSFDNDSTNAGQLETPSEFGQSMGKSNDSYKKKKWMRRTSVGKIAKSVTKGTVMTGKTVVRSSIKVGQAMKPGKPRKIPRLSSRGKIQEKGTKHLSKHKTIKTIEKTTRKKSRKKKSHNIDQIMAGQLTARDQSCRFVSQILAEVSSIANCHPEASSTQKTANILCSKLSPLSDLDTWFLRGGSVELGVVPRKNATNETPCGECVIARCLWESHWREEACLIYENQLDFYAPLSKRPSTTILYIDVQKVRIIDAQDNASPLANLPLMVIETAWRCHYLAFADDERRSTFHEKLNTAIYNCPQTEGTMNKDVWKAHLLQEFQSVVKYSLSEGKGKWATISSSKKSKQRVVLNNRRMAFDCELFFIDGSPKSEKLVGRFVEDLLRQALSFSLETLESCPEDFIHFLDCSSRLRTLPLQKLDLSGKEALCICVNLYHCLLQHSLLLSSHGPPSKKSIGHFMRTNCYEIGGDVFSLAELHAHVIRGSMSKATTGKVPFVQPPKKSRAHLAYALSNVDPRINFVLMTGDVSQTPHVPILSADILDDQLVKCSKLFLRKQVSVDQTKKTVTLPRIFGVYRYDFGDGAGSTLMHYCLQFLEEGPRTAMLEMFNTGTPTLRFQTGFDRFHSILQMMELNSQKHTTSLEKS